LLTFEGKGGLASFMSPRSGLAGLLEQLN
jgi:hypothetical protein